MNAAEGQPGAAASIMENMRGDWRVTPAVSSTTQFDMVHLVIGRPGVILLGEGNPPRVRGLIGQEKRRLAKVIGNAPTARLHDRPRARASCRIRKLRMTLMRLPRTLTGKDVNALDKRLKALIGPAADAQGRDPEEHAARRRARSRRCAAARC